MAQNTGFQQAIYAGKFTTKGSEPLDKDGNFCSVSGQKQAILLLEGHANPDPSKYEVVGSFKEGDVLDGYPSMIYNTDACPLPKPEATLPEYEKHPAEYVYIEIDTNDPLVNGEGVNILGKDWDSGLSEDFGNGGYNRGTYLKRRIGEYEWTLENWKMRYRLDRFYNIYNVDQAVLDASLVPMTLAESETKNGSYAFAGKPTDRYFAGLRFFDPDNLYFGDGINANLFDKSKIVNFNVVNNIIVRDSNAIAFKIDFVPPKTKYTMTRFGRTNNEFKIYCYWQDIVEGNAQFIEEIDGSTLDSITGGTNSYSFSMLFVMSTDGSSINDLPNIKIEQGENSTAWIGYKNDVVLSGWGVPHQEDFTQLFGMLGKDLSPDNIMKHLFVSPNDKDLPWLSSWNMSDKCKDLLGIRFLPCGHKQNDPLEKGGHIFQFGERMGFGLYGDPKGQEEGAPALYFNMAGGYKVGSIVYDNVTNLPEHTSIKFWQRHYRFCRRLTDQELGYKLYRDDANDRIVVTQVDAPAPKGTTEVPKGLLRGLAVRWLNPQKTEVLCPLSQLLGEIEKTQNGGGYDWYGFNLTT